MISVIIPTYNNEKTIELCLDSLIKQNYPKNKYEIIIVDDGSTDNTIEIVKKFKRVKLIKQNHQGPAVARNLGARKSKGEIILFTDSDCIPDKDWIKNMVEPLKDKKIVGVQGTYKTHNKERLIARFAGYEIEERHKKLERKIDIIGTFSAAYKKDIFLKFGGFDEKFPRASAEDTELSFKIDKAGYGMVFQPNAFVYHFHPDNLRTFLKKKFWMGYWRVLLYKKHTKKMFRHSYTPKSVYTQIALIGLTMFFFFLGFIKIIPLSIGIGSSTLTFILTLPFSLKIFRKDKMVGIISPFIIILRDFVTGLGILFGLKNLFK